MEPWPVPQGRRPSLVQVLGTLITEWGAGARSCAQLLHSPQVCALSCRPHEGAELAPVVGVPASSPEQSSPMLLAPANRLCSGSRPQLVCLCMHRGVAQEAALAMSGLGLGWWELVTFKSPQITRRQCSARNTCADLQRSLHTPGLGCQAP